MRRRTWGIVLGGFILAFLLASHLTGARFAGEVEELRRQGEPVLVSELAPKVRPGEPNAAALYTKAFAVAPPHQDVHDALANLEQWNSQQLLAASNLVTTHAAYFRLLDQASRIETCAFPVDWDGGFLGARPDLAGMRTAGEALAVKAHVQARQGDLDGAADTCGTLLRLAEHDRQSPTMYDLLDSIAHDSRATRELSRVLALGGLSPAVSRRLYAQLANADWRAAFLRAMKSERAEGLTDLAAIDRGFLIRGFADQDFDVDWQTKALPFVARPWYNVDKLGYLQMRARQIEACREPWAEANRRLRAIDEEVEKAPAYGAPITRLLPLTVVYLHRRAARTAAQDGAARIALALRIYHHEHGSYPVSLAELTQSGWRLPLDPFTQRPYCYQREGKGFAVWSVGPDLTDNGATEYDPHRFREDQSGYDFVFRCRS